MTYKQYTHDIVIKNSREFIYNGVIETKTGDTYISKLSKSEEIKPKSKGKKATIAMPGLINLHCHLVHTDSEISSQNLFSWLKELVKNNYNIHQMDEGEALKKAAQRGAEEALSYGTSFLVDNTHDLEASAAALKKTGLRGLIGLEIFGSDPEKASTILNKAKDQINSIKNSTPCTLHPSPNFCFSPHACYDVSAELWKMILDYSKEQGLKVLSHIAESEAEEAWFKNKDSELCKEAKEFWTQINTLEAKLKNWKAYKSSVDFMKENDLLDPSLLLAHAVHSSKDDLEELKKNKVNLVTCPRSNLYLKNGLPDYQTWEELGLLYGVGTDSKASNQDLDLRKELEKIDISDKRKFELVTSDAAKILGLEKELGSLEAGKKGDWVVLEIEDENLNLSKIDPYKLALDPNKTKVKEVYIGSEQAFCL